MEPEKPKFEINFDSLNPVEGKLSGAKAKKEMVKSKLPNTVLAKIWKLADIDRDGQLDQGEFALAMYLINIKLEDDDLPDELSVHLVPHSKYKEFFDFKD